jgi:hypothetical protein
LLPVAVEAESESNAIQKAADGIFEDDNPGWDFEQFEAEKQKSISGSRDG